jgi:glycosyltransferase involved in cell wall biosynthesis
MRSDIVLAAAGDPLSPLTWSGTTLRLATGLRDQGFTLTTLDTCLPRRAERAVHQLRGRNGSEHAAAALRTLKLSLAARRIPNDVPWIHVGSQARPPSGFRFVTYDDLTVAQARQYGFFADLGERALNGWQRRQAELFRSALWCAVASRWAADSLVRDYGVPPSKIEVVGVAHSVVLDAVRQRDWSTPRFLFVGHDWDRKHGSVVLEAFRRIRQEHNDATLEIVSSYTGPAISGVTWHGALPLHDPYAQSRLRELFARATCFVMPSALEPWGIAYLEAGAHGVGSIGASLGGAPEAIGPSGISVDPAGASVFEAMRRFTVPGEAEERGLSARKHADNFTVSAVAKRIALLAGYD